MENIGALVRRERLARGWSQEGLCAGICAVSYLSKIEQGKAEPSREMLRLLCQRLALPWEDEADVREALAELENAERLLFAGDYAAFSATAPRLVPSIRLLSRTPHAARAALIEQFLQPDPKPIDERLAVGLDERSLALQRLLRHRFDDALRLYPHAFVYTEVGAELHERGDYTAALRYLERGHALAAEDDAVHLMFRCRLLMGNCHCNLRQTESMRREYERAIRLGKLLNEAQALAAIDYNIATAELESGDAARAYAYFCALAEPSRMDLHKLALCCEKLGRAEEAKAVAERALSAPAPGLPDATTADICRIVLFRLTHADYLRQATYGNLLSSTFRAMRRTLPAGYARFHLPWMLEWLKANRRWKEAYELLQDFPEYR